MFGRATNRLDIGPDSSCECIGLGSVLLLLLLLILWHLSCDYCHDRGRSLGSMAWPCQCWVLDLATSLCSHRLTSQSCRPIGWIVQLEPV